MPEKQAILPRQATVMYVPGRKRAKHLSSVFLAVDGPTTKPINGVTQRNCWTSEITTTSTKSTGKNHRPEKILVTDGVEDNQDIGTKIYLRVNAV